MEQPKPFPEAEAREYRAWLGFWVQLAVLVLLAVVGMLFASESGEPGDYACGLLLAGASVVLAALRVRQQLNGDRGGWGSLLLADNMSSLVLAIVLFVVLGLAGLVVGGTHQSSSVQDGGLALFIVSALLVFLCLKRFFDIQQTQH